MKRCCLASLVVVAFGIGLRAQQVQPSTFLPITYLGTSVGALTYFDPLTRHTTHTVTLKFGPSDNPAYTIDYSFMYPGMRISRPPVVDEVITRHLPDEAQPQFAFNVGGDWTPEPVRQASRASMTRSLSVDRFEYLATHLVRERIFGSELVFTEGQMRMLRQQTVDQWK